MLLGFGLLVWSVWLPHDDAVVFAAPGEAIVEVPSPSDYLVWSEGRYVVDIRVGDVRLEVLAPDGSSVPISNAHGQRTASSLPGRSFSRRSFAAFNASSTGRYLVRASGDAPARRLAITRDPGLTIWGIAAIFGCGAVMACGVLWTLIICDQLKSASSSPSPQPDPESPKPTRTGT